MNAFLIPPILGLAVFAWAIAPEPRTPDLSPDELLRCERTGADAERRATEVGLRNPRIDGIVAAAECRIRLREG